VASFARHWRSRLSSFPRSLSSAKAGERESTPQTLGSVPSGVRRPQTPAPAPARLAANSHLGHYQDTAKWSNPPGAFGRYDPWDFAVGAQRTFLVLRCENNLKLATLQGKLGSSMRSHCTVCGGRLELWERVWGRFDHPSCRSIVLARYALPSLCFQRSPFASGVATSGREPETPLTTAPTLPNAERAQAPSTQCVR
jgi:hypothetical protein